MEEKPKKKFYKKVWFWVIVVIVILIIIGSSSSSPKKVGSNGTSATTSQAQPQNQTFKVGDNIQLGDSTVTVNSVSNSEGSEFMKPSSGNEWLHLNITIQNTGSTQQYVTTIGQMFVRDAAGNSYQVASTDKIVSDPSASLDGTVIANSKRTGWVGFEVPKGDKGLQFQYNGSIFGGGTIVVDLGM